MYYKNCTYFYRAIEKYGWNNIEHQILLQNVDFKTAVENEKYYIKLYKTNNYLYGYNLTDGGEGSSGYKLSDKQKKRMSENRQGIHSCAYGCYPTEETKRLMSEKGKMKIFTDSTRNKMAKEKIKKVYQYNLDGDLIGLYQSASEASKVTNVNVGNLCACCRHIVKKAGGYFWSYEQIENPQTIRDYLDGLIQLTPIHTRNTKPVLKIDLDGNVICEYSSIKSASEDTKIPAQEISHSCKNPNSITRKYRWRYADEI